MHWVFRPGYTDRTYDRLHWGDQRHVVMETRCEPGNQQDDCRLPEEFRRKWLEKEIGDAVDSGERREYKTPTSRRWLGEIRGWWSGTCNWVHHLRRSAQFREDIEVTAGRVPDAWVMLFCSRITRWTVWVVWFMLTETKTGILATTIWNDHWKNQDEISLCCCLYHFDNKTVCDVVWLSFTLSRTIYWRFLFNYSMVAWQQNNVITNLTTSIKLLS